MLRRGHKQAEEKAESSPSLLGPIVDFYCLAEQIDKKLGDKEWVKKIYKKAEVMSGDSVDFRALAASIYKVLGDKKWAKSIYTKAENKAESKEEIRNLAQSILDNLKDHKWINILYKKAPLTKEEIKEFKEAEKEADDFDSLKTVAWDIADAGDNEWAKKVFKKAENNADYCYVLRELAESILYKLGDKEWAKKVYKKAEQEAENLSDFCELADSIYNELGDKEWEKEVYKKAGSKVQELDELRVLADRIHEKLGDKALLREVYKKAEGKAEEESTRRALEWEENARKSGDGLVYIFELDDEWDIDGREYEANIAKYMNHSCDGNCEAINYEKEGEIWITARRNIKRGDELVYDYGYDMEHFLDHPCACGSDNCIGYIVREDQRAKVKKLLKGKKKSKAKAKDKQSAKKKK